MRPLIYKFVKLYTPFICAVISVIHGVLILNNVNSSVLRCIGDFTGHSMLVLLFIWIHSKRMCKWYKLSIIMLFLIHVMNITYYITGIIPIWIILYGGLILNIASVMCWLIFRVTYKTSKAIRSACKHSEIE